MKKSTKITLYFIASLLVLCIDVSTKGLIFAILFYGFALSNLFYAVYLITKYRNSKL